MYSSNSDNRENIKVLVRLRPKMDREFDQCNLIRVEDNNMLIQNNKETKQFSFDHIATENASQYEVFEKTAKPIVDSLLLGYNGTIFVYGQTGSGKTYTLLGNTYSVSNYCQENSSKMSFNQNNEIENKGILPLSIEYLFSLINLKSESNNTKLSCSYLEIYKEGLYDLLDGITVNKQLQIRENPNKSMIVEGLLKIPMTSLEMALNQVKKGSRNRHVGSTNMNSESSRSHAVFSIYLENKSTTKDNKVKTKKSVFHFIDLAGSERQSSTDAVGDRLNEAQKINKSLLNLGQVIRGLVDNSEGRKSFIHYRDSQLTYLLKDSLGGNSMTCIVANISPTNTSIQETLSTLSFAQNAKLIKNKAIINEEVSNDYLYKEEFRKLRDKYNLLEAERNYYQNMIKEIKNGNSLEYTSKFNPKCSSSSNEENIGGVIRNVEEEIMLIMNVVSEKEDQIKYYTHENNKIKEKLLTSETELKLKEKELNEIKEMYFDLKKEQESRMDTINQYVLKNCYLETRASDLEIKLKNKEFQLIKEIEELQFQISENKKILDTKEKTIENLNNDIRSYMEIVNQKDFKIQELKNEIASKENEINGLKVEKDKEINKNKEISTELNMVMANNSNISSRLELKDNELVDLKRQSKSIFEKFEKQVDHYKNTIKEIENKYKTSNDEIRNLNNIITELKTERKGLEGQFFDANDKLLILNRDINNLNDKIKIYEEDKKADKATILKLNTDLEMIMVPNSVNNSQKVIYFKKIKDENTKLKDEINELRSKNELFEKAIRKINVNKISATDLVIDLEKKNSDLNSLRETVHKCIIDIKKITTDPSNNPTQDNDVKTFIESKSLDDKFKFYIEKLFTHLEYRETFLEHLKTRLDVKESEISKLQKEIYYRDPKNMSSNNNYTSDFGGSYEFTTGKKMLADSKIFNTVVKSDIIKSINKKRKYEEPLDESDKENCNTNMNKMEIDNGISISKKQNSQNASNSKLLVNSNSNSKFKALKTTCDYPTTILEARKYPKLV